MTDCRYLSTVFCDDIRQEIGGKMSFMGVYGGDMFLSKLPALLPKLCVFAKAVTPIDNPIRSFGIKVTYGDDVLAEFEPQEIGDIAKYEASILEDKSVMVVGTAITLAPFHIAEPGKLLVHATTESEELSAPGLTISVNEAGGPPQTNL
jgi:hypothetical protein